jgi:hypothetical protein
MTVYIRINNEDELPKPLPKHCIFLTKPTFLDEILKLPKNYFRKNFTNQDNLRLAADEVAKKYDQTLNVFTQLKAFNYEGVSFTSMEEFSVILVKMFNNDYPKIFQKYYESIIKNLPFGTKVVFFKGTFQDETVFSKFAIERVELSDLDKHISTKKQK